MPSNASLQNSPLLAIYLGYDLFMNNTLMFPAILLPLLTNLLVYLLPAFSHPIDYCKNYRVTKEIGSTGDGGTQRGDELATGRKDTRIF
jgi:hypothetical protein